jgi:predicted AlkP superfamily phosphohydrolase/phosphomutase
LEKPRVLFIGFDSAEPALLQQWAEEGHLPNIRRLLRAGVVSSPSGPVGMGNGALWPALTTGVAPIHNGRYYYLQFDPSTYQMKPFKEDEHFCSPPFWKHLSDAGLRVAVIDAVRAPLVQPLSGIQVADYLTHDRTAAPRSYPAALVDELTQRFGPDPFEGSADGTFKQRRREDFVRLRDQCIERIRKKTALSAELWRSERWDLFMTVFADPHDLGHLTWHLHDPSHPAHDPAWAREHGDPIRDVYRELDRSVGELLLLAGRDASIVLFTGPGMGPHYTANPVLDLALLRIERYRRMGALRSTPYRYLESLYLRSRRLYREFVPPAVRGQLRISARTRKGESTIRRLSAHPVASNRKYFALPHNANAGTVRFNVKGREALGVVEPGWELDAVRNGLIEDLQEIVNEESGQHVVQQVVTVKGPDTQGLRNPLPDLFVVWNRAAPIRRLRSPKIGTMQVPPDPVRTGDHSPRSLLVVQECSTPGGASATRANTVEDIPSIVMGLLRVETQAASAGTFRAA